MKSTLGVTLVLAAATSVARADVTLDVVDGTVFATSIEGTEAVDYVRTTDGRQSAAEVVPTAANPLPIHRISHSVAGLAVHSGAGGAASLTTTLFRSSGGTVSNAPFVLRDRGTGITANPSNVRTISLDPSDPGATLLDAGHVALSNGQPRAWAYVRRSSGEALLVDYDLAGGAVRRTPLGFTPPIGSNKGSLVAAPNGEVWGTFASANGVRLLNFYDILVSSVLQPVQKGVIAGGAGFDPGSTRVGIIAILIGLLTQPVPAVSFQRGDELFVSALDGATFRTVAQHTVPPQASGLIEEEGISYYFILPYIEQDNVYKGAIGQTAEPIMTVGH